MKINIISVSALAKQVELTNVLYLRPNAREMFNNSIEKYGKPLPGDVFACDLTDIEDCSGSFVDEFIHNWVRMVRNTENAIFVIIHASEDVLYTISSALNLRNKLDKDSMSILAYENGKFSLLGDKIEKNVREVFEFVVTSKRVTVRMVSEKFSLELNGASNRLKKLYDARLVMREEQSIENGGKYEYFLPQI